MTDRIDLDELTEPTDEREEQPNRGDWLWRDEADHDDEPAASTTDVDGSRFDDRTASTDDAADAAGDAASGGDVVDGEDAVDDVVESGVDAAMPHVPHPNKDKPVGIPIEGGGAGGGPEGDRQPGAPETEESTVDASEADASEEEARAGAGASGDPASPETTTASGPHGGGVDDMTMAFTYGAVTRLADPSLVMADAARWADWVGIVGDVEAPVIHKFQRDNRVDVDFFNGTGTGPGERLAEIGERSMFFAERMVVVGVEGEDEEIARAADWEFVPLSTAAEKADWELAE